MYRSISPSSKPLFNQICPSERQTVSLSVIQSVSQTVSQSVSQLVCQANNQLPSSQCTGPYVYQPSHCSIRSAHQTDRQSVSQSVNKPIIWSASQFNYQQVSQSVSQSFGWSSKQSVAIQSMYRSISPSNK